MSPSRTMMQSMLMEQNKDKRVLDLEDGYYEDIVEGRDGKKRRVQIQVRGGRLIGRITKA